MRLEAASARVGSNVEASNWNKKPRKKSSSEMAELQLVTKAVNVYGGQRVGVSFERVRR